MSERRDWLKLPMDLVPDITKKLPDLPDFTRFRAVCKTWGSTPLSSCPPQLPWVLEWQAGDPFAPVLEREQQFYSLSSGETGTICIDESHWGKEYRGPCWGYLLLLHGKDEFRGLSLFNPLTKAEISLPLISINYHWPVWTSANQTANEVMVVDRNLFEPEEIGMWAYYRPDINKWISVEGIFRNCCYWNGMFFSTEGCEDTKVFHVNSKKLLHEIPPPEDEIASRDSWVSAYLVESSEEILRVSWYIDWNNNKVKESVFRIHRLDFQGGNGRPCWVKINSIGDQMIFLDELNGFSISAKPFPGFRGNCIYFLHLWLKKPHRYDIETGTVETVPCPFELGSWFVPSLQ